MPRISSFCYSTTATSRARCTMRATPWPASATAVRCPSC